MERKPQPVNCDNTMSHTLHCHITHMYGDKDEPEMGIVIVKNRQFWGRAENNDETDLNNIYNNQIYALK